MANICHVLDQIGHFKWIIMYMLDIYILPNFE